MQEQRVRTRQAAAKRVGEVWLVGGALVLAVQV